MSVPSGRPVDPPHRTPAEWNTAVWLIGASDPAHPSGTTYVYGHACHHHACPFTRLHEAGTGDVVLVVTANGVQRYRVERIGYVAKAAGVLPGWASDSTATGRIVLDTCAYEHGDVSTQNLVVVAQQN